MATASSWSVTQDKDNWYVKYQFNTLTGGQIVAVPFTFLMMQNVTPNQFKTNVTYALFKEDGTLIRRAEKTFTALIYPLKGEKIVSGYRYNKSMTHVGSTDERNIDGKLVSVANFDIDSPENNILTPSDLSKAPYAKFDISLKNTSTSDYGKYNPSQIKIVDKLPQGAVMKGVPNKDGKYVYGKFEWTYDEATHTATYVGQLDNFRTVSIELQFPNQRFDTIHMNSATITSDPDTPNEQIMPPVDAYVKWDPIFTESGYHLIQKIQERSSRYSGYQFNEKVSARDVFVPWILRLGNQNIGQSVDKKTVIHSVKDHDLDNRMYYRRIKLYRFYNDEIREKIKSVGYKIYGIKSDGSEVLLSQTLKFNTWFDIDDREDVYDSIDIRFNEPIEFYGTNVEFIIETNVKDDVWASWTSESVGYDDVPYGENQPKRMFNKATLTFNNPGQTKVNQITDFSSTFFRAEQLKIVSYHSGNYTVPYSDDNERIISGNVSMSGNLAPITVGNPITNYVVKNVKYITLLPSGINFVPNSEQNARFYGKAKVVPNYKNTGLTAVIYDMGDITREEYVSVQFKVDTTIYAKEGENVLQHYVVWDDNDTILRDSNSTYKVDYVDALDLDNDGDITEKFMMGTTTINFLPPREVLIKKHVSLDKIGWFLNMPYADANSDIYYRLQLNNNALVLMESVHVLDVLPRVGDHQIVSNEFGQYLPRESRFAINLVESLESVPENEPLLEKWQILYAMSPQGDELENSRDAQFVPASQIDDFSKVTMIKIVLKDGKQMEVKEEANFIIHAKMPTQTDLNLFDEAYNSAAISLNKVDYIEGNKVASPFIKYAVDGVAFFDENQNGILDEKEVRLSGYHVQLMNADGTEYLDENNKTVTAQTNEDGYYHMDVFKRGQYYVKVFKKYDVEQFTPVHDVSGTRVEKDDVIGNDTEQDDTDSMIGQTSLFELSPQLIDDELKSTNQSQQNTLLRQIETTLLQTRNIGLIAMGELHVKKVNENDETLAAVQFDLFKDDVKIATLTTDSNGEAAIDGLPFGQYRLVETKTNEGYNLNNATYSILLYPNSQIINYTIVNYRIKGTVKVTKVDKDDTTKVLTGVTFALQQDGKDIATAITNEQGVATFENVPYGQYTLVEKETLENYILSKDVRQVQITQDGEVIDLGQFANEKVKTTNSNGNDQQETKQPNNKQQKHVLLPKTGTTESSLVLALFSLCLGVVVFKKRYH